MSTREKNDGGPAFPITGGTITVHDPDRVGVLDMVTIDPHPGMTLRDWFAGMAMSAMISKQPSLSGGVADLEARSFRDAPHYPVVALACYRYADAMLKEREK